jgi:hypothetical protein
MQQQEEERALQGLAQQYLEGLMQVSVLVASVG